MRESFLLRNLKTRLKLAGSEWRSCSSEPNYFQIFLVSTAYHVDLPGCNPWPDTHGPSWPSVFYDFLKAFNVKYHVTALETAQPDPKKHFFCSLESWIFFRFKKWSLWASILEIVLGCRYPYRWPSLWKFPWLSPIIIWLYLFLVYLLWVLMFLIQAPRIFILLVVSFSRLFLFICRFFSPFASSSKAQSKKGPSFRPQWWFASQRPKHLAMYGGTSGDRGHTRTLDAEIWRTSWYKQYIYTYTYE